MTKTRKDKNCRTSNTDPTKLWTVLILLTYDDVLIATKHVTTNEIVELYVSAHFWWFLSFGARKHSS